MPTLSTLLVQREIASARTVEEAIARQLLHGGDLATNLLEVAAASEEVVTTMLAESFGLAPAPVGTLKAKDAAVLRLIPGELAFRHSFFPLAVEGGNLVVATPEPLTAAVEEDLSFALNMGIRQLASPLVRIREAIAGYYGIPLDRRMLRLLAKVEGRPDPSPSLAPPPDPSRADRPYSPLQMPRPVSVPPATFGTGIPSRAAHLSFDDAPDGQAQEGQAQERQGRGGEAEAGYSFEPGAPPRLPGDLSSLGLPSIDAPSSGDAPSTSGRRGRGTVREAIATRGLASWLRRAVLEEKGRVMAPEAAGKRARQRRKGPFTAAMAEQELEDALTTDTVLDVFFAFARQFFAFSFLFTVHGDMAEGRNAAGPGAAQLDASSLGVPLNLPSTLSLARARRAPVVAPFASDGLDGEFVRDLGRASEAGGSIAAAVVIPIVVRNRVVALLYGDDGDEAVELALIGDVIAVTALTAGALERLILRKKLSTHRGQGATAPLDAPAPACAGGSEAAAGDAGGSEAATGDAGGSEAAAGYADASEAGATYVGGFEAAPAYAGELEAAAGYADASEAGATYVGGFEAAPASADASEAATASASESAGAYEPAGSHEATEAAAPAWTASELPSADYTDAPPDSSFERTAPLPPRAIPPPPPSSSSAAAMLEEPPSSAAMSSSRAPSSIEKPPELPAEIEAGWSVLPPPPAPTPRETLPAGSLPGSVAFDEGDTYVGMGPGLELPHRFIHQVPEPLRAPPSSQGAADRAFGAGAADRASGAGARAASHDEVAADMLDAEWWSSTSRPAPLLASYHRSVARGAEVPPSLLARRPLAKPIPREEQDSEPPTRPAGTASPPPAAEEGAEAADARSDAKAAEARRAAPPTAPPAQAPPAEPMAGAIGRAAAQIAAPLPNLSALLGEVLARGPESGAAFLTLVERGEQVMPLLTARFPGPLTADRHRTRAELPPASRCGPILELIVAIGRRALPFIAARSTSPDVDVRFWATHVLGELLYSEAATALLPRLFDDDVEVRRIARRSATSLAAEGSAGAPIIQGLSHMTRNIDEPTRRRVLAIETMGEIRVGAMVPPLISALGDPSEDVVDSARRALLFITRQDYGLDARRWSDWWGRNSGRHRIEWLIDALMHEQPSIRRAAGDELKHITREYFGYYDDLPPKERERAQGHYREWWETEGRARFGGRG